MPYCSRCGVEVDDGVAACPLCAAPIQGLDGKECRDGSGPYPQRIIDPQGAYRLSDAERRRIGIELLTLAAGMASAALFLVDMLPDMKMGWSSYAIGSATLAWIASIAPMLLPGRIKTTLSVEGLATIAFLLYIDALDGTMGWSLSLGVPIALASFATIAITATTMASRKVKGINLFGIGAIGLAVYLVVLEFILRFGLHMETRPYWSIIAALALVPVSVLLFYLHGRVLRGADLRKLFRL